MRCGAPTPFQLEYGWITQSPPTPPAQAISGLHLGLAANVPGHFLALAPLDKPLTIQTAAATEAPSSSENRPSSKIVCQARQYLPAILFSFSDCAFFFFPNVTFLRTDI